MPSQHYGKQLFKSIATLSFSFLEIWDKDQFLNQNFSLGDSGKKDIHWPCTLSFHNFCKLSCSFREDLCVSCKVSVKRDSDNKDTTERRLCACNSSSCNQELKLFFLWSAEYFVLNPAKYWVLNLNHVILKQEDMNGKLCPFPNDISRSWYKLIYILSFVLLKRSCLYKPELITSDWQPVNCELQVSAEFQLLFQLKLHNI